MKRGAAKNRIPFLVLSSTITILVSKKRYFTIRITYNIMANLHLALLQTDLHWENKAANLSSLAQHITAITQKVDLIVLPEMFSTGFSMKAAQFAEPMTGNTMQWMQKMAAQQQAIIAGSLIIEENGNYYNRLIWMRPDGSSEQYDNVIFFG